MEGSEYNVEKFLSELTKRTNAQPESNKYQALNNCINESKLYNHVIYNSLYINIRLLTLFSKTVYSINYYKFWYNQFIYIQLFEHYK